MYFNRRVMLYNRQGETKIFEFDTQQKEDEVLKSGNWKENPLDFLPAQIQTESEVLQDGKESSQKADEAETGLQKGHEVESKEPSETAAPVPFQCPKCEFIGKNDLSLKTHTRHRH